MNLRAALLACAIGRCLFCGDARAEESRPAEARGRDVFTLRVTPPLGSLSFRNGKADGIGLFSLGRLGLGYRAAAGFWGEGLVGVPIGIEGVGFQVSLLLGATLGNARPAPSTWTLSTPVFLGLRHESRPNSGVSDGVFYTEELNLVVLGAREVLTRWAAGGGGFELGLEAAGAIPFTRSEPSGSYYSDSPTRFTVEVSLLFGFLFSDGGE